MLEFVLGALQYGGSLTKKKPQNTNSLFIFQVMSQTTTTIPSVISKRDKIKKKKESDTLLGDVMTQFMTRHDAS